MTRLSLLVAVGLTAMVSSGFGVLFGAPLLAGCARAAVPIALEAETYRRELAECRERSSTCPGYVLCRQRVEASHGRSYAGRCEVSP